MKAICLLSGGLDSLLAARLVQEQGVETICLKFKIPFFTRKKAKSKILDVQVKEIDISSDFLNVVKDPEHGYGSNINPCLDCKIFMFSKARSLMKKLGAKFVVTGEVLGQRPMSQYKRALNLIAQKSGLEGLILRPLSAKLLPETIPEKRGWVNRESLLDIEGRTRRRQMTFLIFV